MLDAGRMLGLKGKPGCFGSGVQSKQLMMLSSTPPEQGTMDAQGTHNKWEHITNMVSRKQASCSSFYYFLTVLFPKSTEFQQSYFSL